MIAEGAVAILAAVIPFGIWLWRRRIQKHDDPKTKNQKRREQIAREIVHNDERGANRSLDDDLNRLRSLQGDKRRPAGSQDPGRRTIPAGQ